MKKNELLKERLRQLLAMDKNAAAIYRELAAMAEDPALKNEFLQIATEEDMHIAMSGRMIMLLESAETK
jgi:rubrerythrin